MMKNNEDKISLLKTTINTLGDIKDKVNKLNNELTSRMIKDESGNIVPDQDQETQYEKNLKIQINAFGRLSASMVNGDDIAGVDNLLKQIVDKKNYLYNNLLKGPYGCEVALEKPQQKFPSAGSSVWTTADWNKYDVNSVKRMTYPFPIIYDYNKIKKGDNIPDPWGSNYINKMPIENKYDVYGPGFLSFVFFGSHPAFNRPNVLKISDILPTGTEVEQYNFRSLGRRHEVDNGNINNNQNQNYMRGPIEGITRI